MTSDTLQITLVQSDIIWENNAANRLVYDQLLDGVTSDLVILPEMFTTGFTMNPTSVAESMDGPTLQWMTEKARQNNFVIAGSLVIAENNRYFNRLVWVQPNGHIYFYDKRHLFILGGEEIVYTAGIKKIMPELKGWRILPLVCYDLRFPVWSRQTPQQPYDLLIYVANWPQVRNYPWQQLLRARAIENLAYVAGVNRIGTDGSGIYHSGNSALINFKGEEIQTLPESVAVYTHSISLTDLHQFRQQFPAYMDADEFTLIP
ncbi:MAG: amidohydrolase [Sphingobacteriales bacterium]|nr:MAG: amidohydrolase [Sphingobacteriales bacterium]